MAVTPPPVNPSIYTRGGEPVLEITKGARQHWTTTQDFFTQSEFTALRDGLRQLNETPAGRQALTELKEGKPLEKAAKELLQQKLGAFASDAPSVRSVEDWARANGSKMPAALQSSYAGRALLPSEIAPRAQELAALEKKAPGALDAIRQIEKNPEFLKTLPREMVTELNGAHVLDPLGHVRETVSFLTQSRGSSFMLQAGVDMAKVAKAPAAAAPVASTLAKVAKPAEHIAEEAGELSKFAKVATPVARVGGKVFKVLGVAAVVAEVATLTSQAQAAEVQGQLSPEAVSAYKKILAGQTATSVDPTIVGAEAVVQSKYEDWAMKYVKDPQLVEKLRPSSLMQTLGMPMQTLDQMRETKFYQSLPDKPSANMPPQIRELVEAKANVGHACDALMKAKTSWSGMFAAMGSGGMGGMPVNNDAQLYPDQTKRIDDAQAAFSAIYARHVADGSVAAWDARTNPPPPATQPPAGSRPRTPGS